MRYLDTPASVSTILKNWPEFERSCPSEIRPALQETDQDLEPVLSEMSDLIASPQYPVTNSFLDKFATISLMNELEVEDAQPEPGSFGEKFRQAAFELHRHAANKLLAARAVALATMVRLENAASLPTMAWRLGLSEEERDRIVEQLAEHFLLLDDLDQEGLLRSHWELIGVPTFEESLLRILYTDAPKPSELFDLAARRLRSIAPEVFQTVLLEEIRLQRNRLSSDTLALLPNDHLPDFEQELANLVIQDASNPDVDLERWQKNVVLLARYAGPSVADPVRSYYEPLLGVAPCQIQAAFLSYVLQNQTEAGISLTRYAISLRPPSYTPCFESLLAHLLDSNAPHAALTILARDHLWDPNFRVVMASAQVLERVGQGGVLQELLARLKSLRWDESGLAPNLTTSILQGRGWVLTAQELYDLSQYCRTEGCKQPVSLALEQWSAPSLRLTGRAHGAPQFSLAHYRSLSVSEVLQKLDQLPPDTRIGLAPCHSFARQVESVCQSFVETALARGLILVESW